MLSFLRSGKFWFKAAVYTLGTAGVLLVAGQMLLFFLFDDARVRATVQAAFAASGYSVRFESHIGRSWFPSPNINLYRVALDPKPFESAPPFTAERINIRLSYTSLFGMVRVAKVTLVQPEFNLVRFRDGSWNTDALWPSGTMKQENLPERLVMQGGSVRLYDEGSGVRRQLEAVHVDLDDVRDDAVIRLGARLSEGFAYTPTVSLTAQVSRHQDGYALRQVVGKMAADMPRIGQITAQWRTPSVRWQGHLLNIGVVEVNGNAPWNALSFNINASGADIDFSRDAAQMLRVNALMHWQDKDVVWDGSLDLDSIVRHGATVRVGKAQYELTRKNSEHVQVATLRAAVEADTDKKQLQLRAADIHSVQTEAGGARPLWQVALTGDIRYAHQRFFNADLRGMFDRQPVTIQVGHNVAGQPGLWTAQIDARMLDLTPYLDAHQTSSVPHKLNAAFSAAETWLKHLSDEEIRAAVRIDRLNIDGWQMDAFTGTAKVNRDGISWEKMRADMYGGTIEGRLAMTNTTPRSYRIEQTLHHINVRDWLSDWMNYPYLDGSGNVVINIGLRGNTAAELAASMNGNTLVNINQGVVRGIDIGDLLRHSENLNQTLSERAVGFNRHARTEFTFFTVHTRWVDGVGYTPLIAFGSDGLNVSGQGKFDLNDKSLDYSLAVSGKLSLFGKNRRVDLPLRISGNVEQPVYALDYAAITRDIKREQDKQDAVKSVLQQQWQLLQ